MDTYGASDLAADRSAGVDRVDAYPLDDQSNTCAIKNGRD